MSPTRNFYLSFEYHSRGQGEREKNPNHSPRFSTFPRRGKHMFYSLLEIDKELAEIITEKHLDLGLVLRFAILQLSLGEVSVWERDRSFSEYHNRVNLSRSDFFTLYRKSLENEVDPNVLLSYAFTEALLDILRL